MSANLDTSVEQALIASRIVGKKNSYMVDNPAESSAVMKYLQGGPRPTSFSTAMAKHLVFLEDERRKVSPTPPPTTPPLTGVVTIDTPGVKYLDAISVTIAPGVTGAVTLTGTLRPQENKAVMFGAGADVTLSQLSVFGSKARLVEGDNYKRFQMLNCYIEKTAGIELTYGQSGSIVSILRNRHKNIQRQADGIHPGNFVQLREVTNAAVEIGWNEIINQYNLSEPEDIISVYKSWNVLIHDNLLDGQSTPGNAYGVSSQNPITVEGAGTLAPKNVTVRDNYIIDCVGGIFFVDSQSPHCSATGNRIIQDGLLTDNITQMGNGYNGGAIGAGAVGSSMIGNTFGFVNRDNNLMTPDIPASMVSQNTILTRAQINENAERANWTTKVANAGIKIGV